MYLRLPLIFLLFFLLNGRNGFARIVAPADSVTAAIAPEYDRVSNWHRFWLGENNRKLWALPVKMRVLNLGTEKGGLTVAKLGGGMQTRSLRLKDASGREWVLRTVQKYPARALPENLRPTIAKDILQDQVSTANPFGALVVPALAEALGLPHANPELVYVGDDPGLGQYRKDFANAVYLFEEREPADADDTDNTEKVQKKAEDDNDVSIDQRLVLRARLLDMLVGDWDRHEDNWRWEKKKTKNGDRYSPVPRDRDKVFYKTSGVFPWILSHQWLKSNLQPYSDDVRDIAGWNYNARFFDRYFLTEPDRKDWEKEIRLVQKTITPELAEKALKQMPDTAWKISGPALLDVFIARLANLRKIALGYYDFLAVTADIPLSEKREFVDVAYLDKGAVRVRINNRKKDGTQGRLLYSRTFLPAETKEIRIYGLAGEDVYTVSGEARSALKVRLIGGRDKDVFKVDSDFRNAGRLFVYDREHGGDELPPSSDARIRLSQDSLVNAFNSRSFRYNRFGPMAMLNYNIDQGIQARVGLIMERQGFRKDPYAVKHELWANYSTGRNSWIFTYEGRWKKAIGQNDLSVSLNSLGPNNLTNFFGIGNETEFLRHDAGGINLYRNRLDYLTGDIRLHRDIGRNMRANLGIGTEFYTSSIGENNDRYLRSYNLLHPEEKVFDDKFYAGIVGGLKYDTRNSESAPSRGFYWNTTFTARRRLNGEGTGYGRISTEFNFYIRVPDSTFVIANRIGGGTVTGDPAFFQMMQLGGVNNLRGFHTNRFTGKTMVYHNLDLRLKLFDFTSYLFPGTVGLLGFHDTGRVWVPGQSSSRWHHGYGGGIYVSPADLILIQAAVGFSKEGSLPYISIGFGF